MRVHVDQLNNRYRIAHSGPKATALSNRLDQIAAHRLTKAWEAEDGAADVEAMYFIEHLEVSFALEGRRDDSELAVEWARSLRVQLARAINSGAAAIFRDRADYLAGFLSDFALGRSTSVWYYRQFDCVRSLPAGAMVVRVLAEDADAGCLALIEMARRGSLEPLVVLFSDAECEETANRCLLPDAPELVIPGMRTHWIKSVREFLGDRGFRASGVAGRDLLRLYPRLIAGRPSLGPNVHLARFLCGLLSVAAFEALPKLLSLIESDEWERVQLAVASSNDRRFLAQCIHEVGGRETVALIRAMRPDAASSPCTRFTTSYAGVFLLVPSVLETGVHAELERAAQGHSIKAGRRTAIPLWMIGLQCLGSEYSVTASRDFGLAAFAGLDSPPAPSAVPSFFSTAGPPRDDPIPGPSATTMPEREFSFGAEGGRLAGHPEWDRWLARRSAKVMAHFARRLGSFSDSSPAFLRKNFLFGEADVETDPASITVRFRTCPLQVVVRMAGFDHGYVQAPWLGGRRLEFCFD